MGVDLGTTSQFEGTILDSSSDQPADGRIHQWPFVGTDCGYAGRQYRHDCPRAGFPKLRLHSSAQTASVTLVITNTPGLVLTLQTSTKLVDWTTLATPTPTVSPYTYIDSTSSPATARFYRASYP